MWLFILVILSTSGYNQEPGKNDMFMVKTDSQVECFRLQETFKKGPSWCLSSEEIKTKIGSYHNGILIDENGKYMATIPIQPW